MTCATEASSSTSIIITTRVLSGLCKVRDNGISVQSYQHLYHRLWAVTNQAVACLETQGRPRRGQRNRTRAPNCVDELDCGQSRVPA